MSSTDASGRTESQSNRRQVRCTEKHASRRSSAIHARPFRGPAPKGLETVVPTAGCYAEAAMNGAARLDDAEQELSVATYDGDGSSTESSKWLEFALPPMKEFA